jgi:hypothetical protein
MSVALGVGLGLREGEARRWIPTGTSFPTQKTSAGAIDAIFAVVLTEQDGTSKAPDSSVPGQRGIRG